jgi:tRNA-splicing ligase RtcB
MIQKVLSDGRVPIKIWTKDVEEEALKQLELLSQLPFLFKHVSVMPDVHAGKGSTVGTVIATKDVVIPAAIGVDIGCGMAAVKTPYHINQLTGKLDVLRKYIENSVPIGFAQHKDDSLVSGPDYDEMFQEFLDIVPNEIRGLQMKARAQLGSLGSGNHFIEISTEIDGTVWIVLHSGSRNIGKCIADVHIKRAQKLMEKMYITLPHKDLAFLSVNDELGQQYVHDMQWAQLYAFENRRLMLRLVKRELAHVVENHDWFDSLQEINCHHNYMELENHFGQNVYITRKGAIRARMGDLGIIPGSMGTRSYIVQGLGERESFCSASHGAGRQYSRGEAKRRFTVEDLKRQTDGVECRKDDGVLDEIPSAYKDIDTVIENEKDLVTPIHTLKQIISIKG